MDSRFKTFQKLIDALIINGVQQLATSRACIACSEILPGCRTVRPGSSQSHASWRFVAYLPVTKNRPFSLTILLLLSLLGRGQVDTQVSNKNAPIHVVVASSNFFLFTYGNYS